MSPNVFYDPGQRPHVQFFSNVMLSIMLSPLHRELVPFDTFEIREVYVRDPGVHFYFVLPRPEEEEILHRLTILKQPDRSGNHIIWVTSDGNGGTKIILVMGVLPDELEFPMPDK